MYKLLLNKIPAFLFFVLLGFSGKAQTCNENATLIWDNSVYQQTVDLCGLTNSYTQMGVCPPALPTFLANRNDYVLKVEVESSACFQLSVSPNLVDQPSFQNLFVFVLTDCPDDSPTCIFRQFPIPSLSGANWSGTSTINPISLPSAGSYYIWVSGGGTPNNNVCGEFDITLTPATEGCATCDDGVQNGNETGVDCGGPFCDPCPTADFTINQGGTQAVCDALFADSGNITGNYSILENHTMTFCPDEEGACLKALFSQIDIRSGDFLRVFAGTTANNAFLLGQFTNTQTLPNEILSPSGCLTFRFTSDASTTGAGWAINLTCEECPPASDFVMGNLGTIESCESGVFTDSGDIYHGYTAGENFSFTYCSSTEGLCPNFDFSTLDLGTGATLTIRDGNTITSPVMNQFTTTSSLPNAILQSSTGCVTVQFTSTQSAVTGPQGWLADLFCGPCATCDDGIQNGFESGIDCGGPCEPCPEIFINEGGIVYTCFSAFYDSGGPNGNYGNSENHTIVICPGSDAEAGQVTTIFFESFILGAADRLQIRNGMNPGSPLLNLPGLAQPAEGFNGVQLNGRQVQATAANASGCLRFTFTSGAFSSQPGWIGNVTCAFPCQPFTIGIEDFVPALNDDGIVELCSEISVNHTGNFPNNNQFYNQSVESTNFVYTIPSLGTFNAVGGWQNFVFPGNGASVITVRGFDEQGCVSSNTLEFQVSAFMPQPTRQVSYTALDRSDNNLGLVTVTPSTPESMRPEICINDRINLFAAIVPDTIFLANEFELGGIYLPDRPAGQPFGEYIAEGPVGGYLPGTTISSVADLESVCFNLEHSFSGDLEIMLICPNGQQMQIVPQPNGGGATTYGDAVLGIAVPGNPATVGIGWDYCIENNANPTVQVGIGNPAFQQPNTLSNRNGLSPGTYGPSGNFNSLIGCPVNGVWNLRFRDFLSIDDGHLFSWSLNFGPNIVSLENFLTFVPTYQEWTDPQGNIIVADQNPQLILAGEPPVNQYQLFFDDFQIRNAGGDFTYRIVFDNDCEFINTFNISAIPCDVEAPNIITPNNDNVNDAWVLNGDLTRITRVLIKNRWGNTVYESSGYDNSNPFNGRVGGSNLPDGTYFYIIEMNEQEPLKGSLTILR
ncbi:MAG: gliding motility-associated C-terminal domain-containing protein [Luteibaculaceae bacterium]